ncbi:MAG: PAS domain S-box protein [Armatimonadota bacterium]
MSLQVWSSPDLLRIALVGVTVAAALVFPRPAYVLVTIAFTTLQASLASGRWDETSQLAAQVVLPGIGLLSLGEFVFQMNAEHRRSEAVLSKSEERFSSIFDASAMAIAILDREGRHVTPNRAMVRMFARSEVPLAESRFYEMMHPEDSAANQEAFEELMAGRQNYFQRENRYRLRGHQLLWGRLSVSLVRNAEGQPDYAVSILEDITSRKLAEEALRKSEARFRAIFEGAAIGVALVNQDGRVIESNPALQTMLGYSPEQLVSMSLSEYTYRQDSKRDLKLFQRMMEGEIDHYQIEKRLIRRDGELIWARFTGSLLRDAAGEPQYGIGMIEDITERRRAEDALRETEQRYRSVVDNIKEVIFQTSPDGILTLLNPAWFDLTGFEVEESLRSNLLEFIHPDDRQFFLQSILPVVWRQMEWQRFKVRCVNRDGDSRWVETFYQLTLNGEGNIVGASGTMYDITERMREEAERRRLNEQRENMIATVSHELRAPIAAMILNFDLLADGTLGDLSEEQQQFVQASITSILDLAKTVDDLLAVSRLHDGRVKLHLDRVGVEKLVGQVHDRMLPRARGHHVLLEMEVEPGLPLVETDAQQLAHVVTELVENGIKYSGHVGRDGGRVQVRARRGPDGVLISVSDTGPGIPDHEKSHVFEPFYRSPSAMKDQVPGTGLGLHIVKQIAELMHLQIQATDTPGGGVTFEVLVSEKFPQPRPVLQQALTDRHMALPEARREGLNG